MFNTFNFVNSMYSFGIIKADNVRWYVNHNFLTKDQFKAITGQDFDQPTTNSSASN